MLFNRYLALATLGCAMSNVATAEEVKPDTPATLAGGKVCTVVECKALLDKKEAQFFDTRSAINFGKGHIKGAVMVSYKEKSDFKVDFDATQDKFETAALPADKKAKIVFYSDGPKGWKSYKAAIAAVKAGYANVYWMREGTAGWTEKKFPME